MSSFRSKIFKLVARFVLTSVIRREDLTLAQRRQKFERFSDRFPLPQHSLVEPVDIDGLRAEWVYPSDSTAHRFLLYLHGGGYVMGSVNTHRHLIAHMAQAAAARALAVDYRLAPEHPYPAAVEDAVRAYRWLLQTGVQPAHIAIAGDSAGGGLALSALLALREAGTPLPAAVACLSPWVDLSGSGETIRSSAGAELIIKTDALHAAAGAYLGDIDPRDARVSPVFADLHGLPPLFIQVGTDEVLLDDAKRLAAAARAAGVPVTLEIWDGMVHVWPYFAGIFPEAKQAIVRLGRYLREHVR